jgi:hypothetical protein
MQRFLLVPALVACALLSACDPPPDAPRIEVRSASVHDDSMRLDVSVDGHDREVHITDVEDTRAVAVVASEADGSLVSLVSEAAPECKSDDAVACELTRAALDGTLEELATEVHDGADFRLAPAGQCRIVGDETFACWLCGSTVIDCVFY